MTMFGPSSASLRCGSAAVSIPTRQAEDYVGPDGESVFSAADAVRLNKVLQIAYSFDDLDPSKGAR